MVGAAPGDVVDGAARPRQELAHQPPGQPSGIGANAICTFAPGVPTDEPDSPLSASSGRCRRTSSDPPFPRRRRRAYRLRCLNSSSILRAESGATERHDQRSRHRHQPWLRPPRTQVFSRLGRSVPDQAGKRGTGCHVFDQCRDGERRGGSDADHPPGLSGVGAAVSCVVFLSCYQEPP